MKSLLKFFHVSAHALKRCGFVLLCGGGLALFSCAYEMEAPEPPRVLLVPADFASLQEAIDAARDGDQIIYSGPYQGRIDFKGKHIALRANETAPAPAASAPEAAPRPAARQVRIMIKHTTASQAAAAATPPVPSYPAYIVPSAPYPAPMPVAPPAYAYYDNGGDDYPGYGPSPYDDYAYYGGGYPDGRYYNYSPGYIAWGVPYATRNLPRGINDGNPHWFISQSGGYYGSGHNDRGGGNGFRGNQNRPGQDRGDPDRRPGGQPPGGNVNRDRNVSPLRGSGGIGPSLIRGGR